MQTVAARSAFLPAPTVLVWLIAVSSAAALMLEIVAGRLVAPFIGMSLHSWTAIIAVVLAGLSLGALLGGRLADGPLARGRDRLVLALGLAAVFTLLTPVLLRRTASLTAGGLDPTLEVLVLATAMLLVPSVFAGIVSPLATRLALAQTAAEDVGRMLGRIFAAGAAGSIVGTLLAGFVLIGFLGSLWSVILIAGLYALAALSALPGRGRWRALALLAAGGGAVYGVGLTLDAWRSPCNAESAYSCIRIEDRQALGAGPSRVLVIDHLVHGINVRDHPDHFVMGYIELVDLLARHRFDGVPERAFFVGGGAYTLPRAWLAAGGEAVVAELDPLVTTTAIERLWLEPAAGLVIHHQDARVALAAQQGDARPFDLIFGDAFQDVTVPPHLVTVEFAELVRDRLHPDGFYVINVIDHALEPRFAAAVARTLAAVFPEVAIWRERADLARSGRVNHVITASERPLDLSAAEGAPPYNRQWHPIRLDLDAPILTDDHSPVERLLAAGR